MSESLPSATTADGKRNAALAVTTPDDRSTGGTSFTKRKCSLFRSNTFGVVGTTGRANDDSFTKRGKGSANDSSFTKRGKSSSTQRGEEPTSFTKRAMKRVSTRGSGMAAAAHPDLVCVSPKEERPPPPPARSRTELKRLLQKATRQVSAANHVSKEMAAMKEAERKMREAMEEAERNAQRKRRKLTQRLFGSGMGISAIGLCLLPVAPPSFVGLFVVPGVAFSLLPVLDSDELLVRILSATLAIASLALGTLGVVRAAKTSNGIPLLLLRTPV